MNTSTTIKIVDFSPSQFGGSVSNQTRDRGPRSFPAFISEWESNRPNILLDTRPASKITLVDFEDFRQRARETGTLPEGWDSGNAGPMSEVAIRNAIRLIDLLESARISPSRVVPTCDDSILIRYQMHTQTVEWEFFSQGDNVRAQIAPDGEESYLEIPADQISQYI
jgi:hypothetical protein